MRMKTQKSNKQWSASWLIFPLLCLVIGSIAVGVCFRRVWGSYASSSWPVVSGKVIQSANDPGVVGVEHRILFVLGVYVLFIGAVVTIAGIVRALRPIRAPQEVVLPAGLVIERKRRGMIDDDNESMSYMTLEIPKGSAGVWQFLGIFIALWPMPAVVWIAINGSFSLWWPSLMALGVPVVFG